MSALLSFELSMPGVNSWSGKWSGEGGYYAVVRRFGKDHPKPGIYGYSFGDGWRAAVTVRTVDGVTARRLRRLSTGFYGYEWMIDSIIEYGLIKS